MRLSFALPSVICAALLGAPVWATCPSATDLSGGVRFEMAAGAYWDVQAQGQDRVAQFQWSPEFPVQTMELARGVFVSSIQTSSSGQPWRATFAPGPGALPRPAAGREWTARMTTTGPGLQRVDDVRYVFGAEQRVTFGPCAYVALPMELHTTPVSVEGERQVSGYLYFPEFSAVVISHDGIGTQWPLTGISVR